MLSKGLAETYNIFKDKDKPEFEKTDLFTTKFLYELGQNVLLGAAWWCYWWCFVKIS